MGNQTNLFICPICNEESNYIIKCYKKGTNKNYYGVNCMNCGIGLIIEDNVFLKLTIKKDVSNTKSNNIDVEAHWENKTNENFFETLFESINGIYKGQ